MRLTSGCTMLNILIDMLYRLDFWSDTGFIQLKENNVFFNMLYIFQIEENYAFLQMILNLMYVDVFMWPKMWIGISEFVLFVKNLPI